MPKEAESCLFPTISNFLCYNSLIRPDVVQHRILSYAAIDCHRKVVINITKEKQKTQHERLSPEELEAAIAAAKEQDAEAIAKLCAAFTPLILKEAHYPSVWQALDEDAVNTAWVIFLEFIKKYNGCDYRHLPGLIQCHLRYELLHCSISQNKHNKNASLEDALQKLGYSPMDGATFNLSLKQALSQLSEKEQLILRYCYEANLTQQQTAEKLGCSERSVRRYHSKALSKLKKHLNNF